MLQKVHIAVAILLFGFPMVMIGQNSELSIFNNLVNKTWIAKGQWENNGPDFHQEIQFKYGLENTIVISDTKGFINEAHTQFGHRNHGIRQYDEKSNSVSFWEYDVFGNVTKGTVTSNGKDIIYQYQYGENLLTDMWKYIDNNTYSYKVGTYTNGKWEHLYLDTVFKVKN